MSTKDEFYDDAVSSDSDRQIATYEDIYLKEDRAANPKEIFKQVADILDSEQRPAGTTVLDAGCATGEFLVYLQRRFPHFALTGVDIADTLIKAANRNFPDIDFRVGSVTDPNMTGGKKFDVILCVGVIAIFDDPEPALVNFMNLLKPGGTLLVSSSFNEDPIDVLVRYRPSDEHDDAWKVGWNIFSQQSVNRMLKNVDADVEIDWHRFRMPFAIPKRDDPMRSWTIETADDPFQQTNGVCQLRKVFTFQARRPGA